MRVNEMFRNLRVSGLVVSCLIAALAATLGATGQGAEKDSPSRTVRLIIDYGDGVQKHFTQLRWQNGMTVLDALEAAQKHPRGIEVKYRGKGATAFLTQIDDLENQGRGRNWVYRVNGKLADRSFARFTLKSGDTVLWKFGQYR
jgi:hypothetical protein